MCIYIYIYIISLSLSIYIYIYIYISLSTSISLSLSLYIYIYVHLNSRLNQPLLNHRCLTGSGDFHGGTRTCNTCAKHEQERVFNCPVPMSLEARYRAGRFILAA